jgi:tetratricopeptide (TPR) repeat protein
MSDTRNRSEEKNIRIVLSRFISHYRMVFIVILVIIVAALIAVGVYSTVNQKRVENSAVAAEELQELYEEWNSAADDEKADLRSDLESKAADALKKFKRMYAAQRAYMVLGQLHYQSEEYDAAVENYESLADSFPKSYLAPISLMSAAAAWEQLQDYESAIAAYRRVSDEYSDSFPSVAYALVSIGRLYERMGQADEAVEAYNEVVDNFSGSGWTNIAQDRIIYLETAN